MLLAPPRGSNIDLFVLLTFDPRSALTTTTWVIIIITRRFQTFHNANNY